MARRKHGETNIRKLTRLGGGSMGLTLPIELVDALGWKEKQKVVVQKKGRHLIIKDWKAWGSENFLYRQRQNPHGKSARDSDHENVWGFCRAWQRSEIDSTTAAVAY